MPIGTKRIAKFNNDPKWQDLPLFLCPDLGYKREERLPKVDSTALVLLSGGQDSTTCLAWAIDKFVKVEAVAFDYGQRHRHEIEAAKQIATTAGIDLKVIPLGGLCGSALTDHTMEVSATGGMDDLPTTFTPGRNAVFLSTACGYAATRDIRHIVTGICQTDYSGYPDCREDFREAMESAMSLALGREVYIHAPRMFIDKAETVRMAMQLDALHLVSMSLTCYDPQVAINGGAYPCRACPACLIRLRGFNNAGIKDPAPYAFS